ncbi:MAG: TonB-dependent outer membrane protein SusC/RagA [Gemmatimonadetes bacterium]|nr:TonB-dependent outer membrane protein SusC/RagA [Gemmatimonadota bacterium]
MTRFVRIAVLATIGLSVALPVRAQQGTGTIAGQVTEGEARRPVASAQVFIVGQTLGTRTDATGNFRIGGVPAGPATIRVSLLGFQSVTRTTTVAAGSTTTLNVSLTSAPSVLSAVVVTASGVEQRRRENGASVSTVNADTLPKAAIQNFSQVLSGRTAGVTVAQSSGTTGTGARVRIRGANSMSLSNEPLLIIDGVRIDNSPESNTIGVGGQSPSRLNDINPEDIESFDVIKGPAAAALYGTAAANGVIQITTKRGVTGRTSWNVFSELGTVVENNRYPANYGSWTHDVLYSIPGTSDTNNPSCSLYYQAQGYCTIDSLAAYNTIEQSHPFRTGHRQKLGANVSGGSQLVTYFLSADADGESGVYHTSNLNRYSLRGNFGAHPTPAVDLSISTGYINSRLQLPQNDNNYYGVISNGLAGWPAADTITQGYNPLGPKQFENIDTRQELGRFTGSGNGTWRINSWLAGNATLGLDQLNRFDSETLQPGLIDFSDAALGSRESNRITTTNITTNYALTARNDINPTLRSTAQVGYQYQQARLEGTLASGKTLTAGSGSLGGVNSDRQVNETYADNKTAGGFVSEQLAFYDRLFITATLRADKNSAFGKNFGLVKYPAASVSYVVLDQGERLSQLRVRAAYGESGLRPGILDAIAYSNPVAVRLNSGDRAGITVGNLSNPDLRAEHSREFEGGFDLGLYGDRARLEFTAYDKKSRDALVLKPFAQSVGGPVNRYVNLGAVSNRGVEAQLTMTPLQTDRATLGLTVTASGNRNRLLSLGDTNSKPIIFGLNSSQRHAEGYPLGSYFGTTVDSFKVSNNGFVSPDSVFFRSGESAVHYLGTPLPTRQASIAGDLLLFRVLRVGSLFEYHGGNTLYNASEQFRCAFQTCRAINDITAPAADQANAEAASINSGFYGGYVEDASFVKWRELTVGVSVPSRYLAGLRANDAALTFGVRNLHTWTKYSGLDPEVNYAGQSNFNSGDFLTQPQVRYYTLRLNLTF